MLPLQKDNDLLKVGVIASICLAIKYFLIEVHNIFNAITHLIDSSIVQTTFTCTGKSPKLCDLLYHDCSILVEPSLQYLWNMPVLETARKGNLAQSCLTLCDPMDCIYNAWNSPGQNTGVSSLSLLQGIFPTQGLNPGLLHRRWILYQLSHKEGCYPASFMYISLTRI